MLNVKVLCKIFLYYTYVGAPDIIYPPKDQKVGLSTDTSFTCTAVGSPLPSIDWIKDNHVLKNKSSSGAIKYKIFIDPPVYVGNCSTSECGIRSTLVIQNVVADDEGVYTCNASNSIGNAIGSAELKIGNIYRYITSCCYL